MGVGRHGVTLDVGCIWDKCAHCRASIFNTWHLRYIMNGLTTILFSDASSGDEACVVIRYDDESVAFALSLASNGDVEVVMNKETLCKLIDALTNARSRI